jgi:prepilin signal peptidase PulO-like enzyme (type II secretory pathway)
MTEPTLMTTPNAEGSGRDVARIATAGTAAFLSLLAAIRYGMDADAVVAIFVLSVLVVVSRHDLERRIIPNRIVLPAWVIVLVANIALHPSKWREWLVASFGAGLFFLVVALAYRGGLGMGDVKFVALIGAALGRDVVTALVIGTFAAAAVAAVILLREGSAGRKRAIPLGPFLALGAAVVLLFL